MTIVEKARELGVALANTDAYKRMLAAQVSVESNVALKSLLDEFQLKRGMLVEMFQKGDYDNGLVLEISKDTERLQAQMMENPVFSDMLDAEKQFSELVASVDQEINACIGGKKDSSGCSGNCGSCGGCGGNLN